MLVAEGVTLILFSSICISFQTGDVRVRPIKYEIEPGSIVTFTCETSQNISQFHWEIHGEVVNGTSVNKQTNHSMTLRLNTTDLAKTVRLELDVLCVSDNGRFLASSTIYFGYVPLAPKIECMMQNLDAMHCRWNHCDPRTKKYPERLQANKYYVSYHTTQYTKTQNKHGNCSASYDQDQTKSRDCQTLSNGKIASRHNCSSFANSLPTKCSSFCSSTKASGWEYWHGVEIRLEAENRIGRNVSKVLFTPRNNVVLSPPKLNVQNVTTGDDDSADVLITAGFPSMVRTDHFFLEYCEKDAVMEIRYKKVPDSFDETISPENVEEKFWIDWSENITNAPSSGSDFLADSPKMVVRSRQARLRQLQANSTFVVQVRWKYEGTSCVGIWSPASVVVFKTRPLKPPKFLQASILYFDDKFVSNFSQQIYAMNASSVILWRHKDESYQVYQNNEFCYRISSTDDKCFSPVTLSNSSNFGGDINVGCRLRVTAFNHLGNSSTPYSVSMPANADCIPVILSMQKTHMSGSLMSFKIEWTLFSRNVTAICKKLPADEHISVSLFAWEENCTGCRQKVIPSETPSHINGPVRSFNMDVSPSQPDDGSKHFELDFRTKDLSSSVGFSYQFQPSSAYGFAVSLPIFDGETLIQGPAYLANGLFYYGIGKPVGIPLGIMCDDVDESSMILRWRPVPAQTRKGPILGYIIYITESKRCFSEESGESCRNPYENCDQSLVRNRTVYLQSEETEKSDLHEGWFVETTLFDREYSYLITNLQPGTHHYIGLAAVNAAGTGECFGFITQATKAEKDIKNMLVAGIFLAVAVALLCLFFILAVRKRITNLIRRPVPRPVILITMRPENQNPDQKLDEDTTKVDLSFEYAHLFDEMRPLNGETGENNNYNGKTCFCRKDESPCGDKKGIAPYLRNANVPPAECNHEADSLSTDTPCCSTSTGNESSPSIHCEYSGDGMSSDEEDAAVYTSTETALINSHSRWRFLM